MYMLDDTFDEDAEGRDPNAMDWSPTVTPARASVRKPLKRDDNGFILKPQTFYAPEEPTGLENLFEKTIKLADGDEPANGHAVHPSQKAARGGRPRGAIVAIGAAAVCSAIAVGLGVWSQRDRWR